MPEFDKNEQPLEQPRHFGSHLDPTGDAQYRRSLKGANVPVTRTPDERTLTSNDHVNSTLDELRPQPDRGMRATTRCHVQGRYCRPRRSRSNHQ